MFLDELIAAQKRGEKRGIPSICSAQPWVLKAALRNPRQENLPLLVESTCNQVNQFGGYTGMVPSDFVAFVHRFALECDFPPENILLGGDHLGPSVWQKEPADIAMGKAVDLVKAYIQAGFTKIHLDASMKLGDDPPGLLAVEVSVGRAAQLAQAAEIAHSEKNIPAPRYVIGTEVPIPGGARSYKNEIVVTDVPSVRKTIDITRRTFYQLGLIDAWERVIAIVVQPGVEFGSDFVVDYRPEQAVELARFIETQPNLIYEAHSTDYQTRAALSALVRDHFAILKVGPALTFAFREAVFALARIEEELFRETDRSQLVSILDSVMLADPRYWQNHYTGDPEAQALARKSSFSDRTRYYWPVSSVQSALKKLLENLEVCPLPLTLVSQYLPVQYEQIRAGLIANTPQAVIQAKICEKIDTYLDASVPDN